jgi:hypothetical protein
MKNGADFKEFKLTKDVFKEGPLTKNCPIDFVQNWAIYLKKSYYINGEEKKGGTFLGP